MRPVFRSNITTSFVGTKCLTGPASPLSRQLHSGQPAMVPTRLAPALDAKTSDVGLADAVEDYLALTPAEQKACWTHMQQRCADVWPRQVHSLAQRVAVSSQRSLQFFASVRELCHEAAAEPWARQVDTAMAASVRPLYGAAFLRLQQLYVPDTDDVVGGQGGLGTETVQPRGQGASDPVLQPLQPNVLSAILAQVKAGETVHKTDSDEGFVYKFGRNRTIHALLHSAEPRQLLAVLYTSHLHEVPASMDEIDRSSGGNPGTGGCWRPAEGSDASVACFYSVSSHAAIARGLRMGTNIIYRTAAYLASTNPSLRTFVTLSPIPEFCPWLFSAAEGKKGPEVNASLQGTLAHAGVTADGLGAAAATVSISTAGSTALEVLINILKNPGWWHSSIAFRRTVIDATAPLVRVYLKSTGPAAPGQQAGTPLCRVAAFHLGNGAKMARICAGADPSPAGLARSAGFNVNYRYSGVVGRVGRPCPNGYTAGQGSEERMDGSGHGHQGQADEGMAGLQRTMREGASSYAADPAGVLAAQDPVLIYGAPVHA